jgi:hypothetical protein
MRASISAMPSDPYQFDSNAYSGEDEAPSSRQAPDRQADQPWWERSGFASYEEYIQQLEEEQDRFLPRSGESRRKINAAQLPGGGPPPMGATRSKTTRQVNCRLTEERFEQLGTLAEDYGVTVASMARLLISNAVIRAMQDRPPRGRGA